MRTLASGKRSHRSARERSAPCSSSSLTTSGRTLRTAAVRGVSPVASAASTSAPACSSDAQRRRWPPRAATRSAVAPNGSRYALGCTPASSSRVVAARLPSSAASKSCLGSGSEWRSCESMVARNGRGR
eukprot:scaffold15618_cov60-Phaeocystis_antarctica.AAC.4